MRWLRGLNLRDLTIEDRYLLVIIHALNYCEEYKERYIRYCHLKRLCDKTLRSIGMSCLSNRTYDNILEYCEEEKLIRTESLPYKKERRIYPHKKAIEGRV